MGRMHVTAKCSYIIVPSLTITPSPKAAGPLPEGVRRPSHEVARWRRRSRRRALFARHRAGPTVTRHPGYVAQRFGAVALVHARQRRCRWWRRQHAHPARDGALLSNVRNLACLLGVLRNLARLTVHGDLARFIRLRTDGTAGAGGGDGLGTHRHPMNSSLLVPLVYHSEGGDVKPDSQRASLHSNFLAATSAFSIAALHSGCGGRPFRAATPSATRDSAASDAAPNASRARRKKSGEL